MTSSGVPETGARWSDATEQVLIEASNQHIALQNTGSSYRCSCGEVFEISDRRGLEGFEALRLHQFRASLAALADAGLLLPPGGETREEWAVEWTLPSGATGLTPTISEVTGEELIGVARRWGQPGTRRTVCRTVHLGPWLDATPVVPTPPESAPASSAQGDEGGAESPTSAPPAGGGAQ